MLVILAIPVFAQSHTENVNDEILNNKDKYLNYLKDNPETETRQIIVKFRDEAVSGNLSAESGSLTTEFKSITNKAINDKTNSLIKKMNLSSECSVVRNIGNNNVSVLKAKTNDVNALIDTLNNDENVIYAQQDYKVVTATDNVEVKQWAVQNYGQTVDRSTGENGFDLNLVEAWKVTEGSEDVVVGVIDTGIDISHPDLLNNIWINDKEIPGNGIDDDGNGYVDDVYGWDFCNDDNSVYDMDALDEHGTHMAGIIAANGNIKGVAPKVKVMPLKALNYSSGYTSDIIEAIEYAKNQGVKIINCSFASIQYNPALEEAIASNPDILFVCAAGNYGKPTTEIATFPACYDLDNILTVSASNNKGRLSEISSYGEYVDVSAPGIGIYSTIPENTYDFKDGTSCSAAFVSGMTALLLSENNDLCAVSLKNKIINSCGNSLPKQVENNDILSEGMIDVAAGFDASEIIGKNDGFKYNTEAGEYVRFVKYPFEFFEENGALKLRFDSQKEISKFNLKLYRHTENKEHMYLVNSDLTVNEDYIISGIEQNVDYDVIIKSIVGNDTIEYIATLKYIVNDEFNSIDFDVLTEQHYDANAYVPMSEDVYYTAEEKDNLVEVMSSGTKNEQESNDSIALADRTYDDYNNYGYISSNNDVDYFKVKFSTKGVANFWLGNIPDGTDYDLFLYDEGGTLLARSTKGENEAELISSFPVNSNTFYYMMVESASGYSTTSPYLLRAKWYETPSSYESNDTISTAYELPGYTYNVISEKISSSSDVDYYKVYVPRTSIFELRLTRPNSKFRFEIYKSSNTSQSIVTTTSNSYMGKLSSGTYYIKIFTTSGYSSSSYTLKVSCNPLYAIGNSATKNGEMAATDNVYYELTLTSALGIKCVLSNFGSSDYDLYLYDSDYSEITSSTDVETTETIQSVLQPGTYLIRVHRCDGTDLNFRLKTSVVVASNDAYLTTATGYPSEMKVNEVKAVTIRADNEGASVWTAQNGYKLAALNDSASFVSGDRTLSTSDSIGYGSSKSFIFNIKAPEVDVITSYTMGWRMKQNSLEFGDKITKNVTVRPDYDELTIGSFTNVWGKATEQMYMFTVETSGYYAIRTFYYSTDVDTKLTLYNSTMKEIDSNDDIYSGNLYSRIEAYLTPGIYYVALAEYDEKPLYCQIAVENFEINTINVGNTKSISNEYEGYYKFTVSSSGTYIIGTKYYSQNSDTFLVLYDGEIASDAKRIAYNDNDSSNYSRITVDLDSGTYYIRVTTYDYLKEAAKKKVYCKLSLSKQSTTPSTENRAGVNITYPSNNSVIRLYDGASLKISGGLSNVSSVSVKVNGKALSNVKKTGNRFECYYTPTQSGTYTIVVSGVASYGGEDPIDTISVTLLVNDDGDTFDTATSVKVGTERTSAIDYEEDVDCFMFIPSKSDVYSIHTTGETDTVVSIYNDIYSLMSYNDDDFTKTYGTNADAPIFMEKNKVYYIMIHGASQEDTGIYKLCIDKLYDDNTKERTMTLGQTLSGRIDYPGDEDVFTFYPETAGTYTFKTVGISDMMGTLYDSNGNFIEFSDDASETNSNCLITVDLDAGGPYYFSVKHSFSFMYRQNYKVVVEQEGE